MTAIQTDAEALLRRICETPEDDAPRMIYADAIQEAGDDERAEFIRLQIELANNNPFGGGRKYGERRDWLRNRETHLLNLSPNGGGRIVQSGNWWEWGGKDVNIGRKDMSDSKRLVGLFSRGFISEIRLTCAEFMGGTCGNCNDRGETYVFAGPESHWDKCEKCHGNKRIEGVARELFGRHPIERVVLTDKRPFAGSGNNWGWFMTGHGGPEVVPKDLFLILSKAWNKTEAAAMQALSDACVAYGRQLAGLPPLK